MWRPYKPADNACKGTAISEAGGNYGPTETERNKKAEKPTIFADVCANVSTFFHSRPRCVSFVAFLSLIHPHNAQPLRERVKFRKNSLVSCNSRAKNRTMRERMLKVQNSSCSFSQKAVSCCCVMSSFKCTDAISRKSREIPKHCINSWLMHSMYFLQILREDVN